MLMLCCVLAAAAVGPACVLVRACGVVCARDACVRARVRRGRGAGRAPASSPALVCVLPVRAFLKAATTYIYT